MLCKKSLKIPKVIKIRKSKKNRQHNGQKKKYKRTNNDLQNTTLKNKDRATRTPLKTGGELRCSGRESSSCSISGTRRVISDAGCKSDIVVLNTHTSTVYLPSLNNNIFQIEYETSACLVTEIQLLLNTTKCSTFATNKQFINIPNKVHEHSGVN